MKIKALLTAVFLAVAVAPALYATPAGIAEHPQPRRILTQISRMPAHLHRAGSALRVRHHDGEAAVRRGQAGDASGRAVGVERIRSAMAPLLST
jgi:hypothetical protein